MRRLWYNSKFGAHRMCARRQIKKSQYSNWLHSPTHFREHSVALLSRPNVHDLWRVRFRNFLTCGFYLGGLLISFTSFLCFNYSTNWLLCQYFFNLSFLCLLFIDTRKSTGWISFLKPSNSLICWFCGFTNNYTIDSLKNINSHNHYLSFYCYYNTL